MRNIILGSLIAFAATLPALAEDQNMVFPSIQSQNLNKDVVNLPADFSGDINLVIFAFKRNHQALVDTWLPAAETLAKRFKKFNYYELPSVGRQPKFMKSVIDNGMRSGIQDVDTRGRTITLYVPKGPLMNALDMGSDRTIYAMLLDGQDRVIWRAEGAANAEVLSELKKAVAAAF
ncbi:MAG: hypothetical protein ACI8YI_001842 [Paracoccaceae bacterium]|jgi:hypothetical protein